MAQSQTQSQTQSQSQSQSHSQPIPTLHRTTPSTSSTASHTQPYHNTRPDNGAFSLSPTAHQSNPSTSPGNFSDASNEAVRGHSYSASPHIMSTSAHPMSLAPSESGTAATAAASSSSSSTTPFPSRPSISSRASTDDRNRPSISTEHSYTHPSSTSTTPTTAFFGSSANTFHAAPPNASSSSRAALQQQPQTSQPHLPEIIPPTFDEATLRALCDTDVGVPLLYERIKQSMNSCREASGFFRKRAALEEEYGRTLQKLAKSSLESYGSVDGKAGTYVTSYHTILATHEQLAESRLKFAQRLTEMSEDLSNLVKEVDRNRKAARDTGSRLERNLLDAEQGVEKARTRFDSAAEDLERLLLVKSGESAKGGELAAQHASTGPGAGGQALANKGRSLGKAMSKGGMQLFKNSKNPQQLLRQEEEVRARTSQLSDTFRREVLQTQQMRQEYFNLQLPRILRSLKESADEIDNGLQFHLSRYAFLFESTVLADGMVVTPIGAAAENTGLTGSVGLKQAAESIDNRADFKTFMQNYSVLHARDYKGPRREGPYEEGFVNQPSPGNDGGGGAGAGAGGTGTSGNGALSNLSNSTSAQQRLRPIFGVDLATQMGRDNVDVPGILVKCAAAVEAFGKENIGIYRLSGTTSKVQRLKAKFDADWTQVDLFEDEEALSDVNIVSGCLKLWFRELPEPLLTWELYRTFVDAAKVENDRLRHIRLHEVVNQLPDANYSTLKALMGHLDRIRSREHLNQMSASNLAIVFGPTLLNPPPAGMVFENQQGSGIAGEGSGGGGGGGGSNEEAAVGQDNTDTNGGGALQDMAFQSKAVETILVHYADIFLEEEEIEALEQQERDDQAQADAMNGLSIDAGAP